MKREEKERFVADLHSQLEKAVGAFLVNYQGLNVEALNRLRRELRKIDAEFRVVKNRLLKLASQGTDTEMIKEHMQGPSAVALTYEDVVAPAKVLIGFAKDFKQFQIRNCQISGRVLDAEGVKRLAELPGRDVLLAQTLSVMQAVPTSLVRVLSGVMAKLLNVLKAIEREKGKLVGQDIKEVEA
ncbi:MAG: 50S ribosomal protein L10 [Pseudomonadota bacterium]